MIKDPFEEYILETEPNKKERGYIWSTAVGLQKVDGLETSDYLKSIAIRNIEGDISIDDVEMLIKSYYIENSKHSSVTEEADLVSVNIARLLAEKSFTFSPNQYLNIHKRLFYNVYKHAGKIRTYNISKKEWVLGGMSILYGDATILRETLEYDFSEERKFDYSSLTTDEFIKHIARFISNLWQIHVFCEGNTRTTAIFLIKYLQKFGYNVNNDIFANNAWYFRNALVRANYNNAKLNVYETTKYLELFLRNLLLNENNDLKNRYLHINFKEKVDIEDKKVDIEDKKVDIEDKKVDIESLNVSNSLKYKINLLYSNLYKLDCFGRSDIINILSLSKSGASKLISKLLDLKVITPIYNHGKGKYKFLLNGLTYEQ